MKSNIKKDVVCIGGGIMSVTLAKLIQELDPNINITIYEKLSSCALESTQSINNAGTGHAGFCELNYTPLNRYKDCLLYTSPSPRDRQKSRMPSSA